MRTTESFLKDLTKDTYRFLANKKLSCKSSWSFFQGRGFSYFCRLNYTFWINCDILKLSFFLLFSISQNFIKLLLQIHFSSIVDIFKACEMRLSRQFQACFLFFYEKALSIKNTKTQNKRLSSLCAHRKCCLCCLVFA